MIDVSLPSLIRFDEARPSIIPVADSGNARVLLICLRAGQVVKDHRSASQVIAHCLSGRVSFFTDGVPREMAPGTLALVEPNRFHRLEAAEESVLLVIMTPHPSREGYPRDQVDRIISRA